MSRATRLLGCTAMVTALGLPATASAHMGSTKYVQLDTTGDLGDVTAVVDVQAVDVGMALGLGMNPTPRDVTTHSTVLQRWLTSGLQLSTTDGPCTPSADAPAWRRRDGKWFVSVPVAFACPGAAPYTLSDTTVFEADPDHRTFVTATTSGGQVSTVLRPDQRSVEIDAAPSASTTARGYLLEGGWHLLTGWDHLLFLLSLLLIATLGIKDHGRRAVLGDLAWIVTAFTVGHCASLCAAALGLLALPSAWVEAGIAASIVFVAAMNVLRPRPPSPATRRLRVAVALGFGLIHGFGFSSVLADVGLSSQHRLVALASFNLGIELAQMGFVAALLVPLGLLARRRSYRPVFVRGGSLAIATMGCLWLIERSLAL